MKIRFVLFIIFLSFILAGCVTTSADETAENQNSGAILTGVITLTSPSENLYDLVLSAPLESEYEGDTLMVQFIMEGILKSGMGCSIQKNTTQYHFKSGYDVGNGKNTSLLIFIDSNGDYNKDSNEKSVSINFKDLAQLQEGIHFTFNGVNISSEPLVNNQSSQNEVSFHSDKQDPLYKGFQYPVIDHDLSGKTSVPASFDEREGEPGIGLIDFTFNAPLWFYWGTTLKQIVELMGKEPDDQWLKGGPEIGTFKFDTTDGGFILFAFDDRGLWMIYPRGTSRFTQIGFPRLPWNKAIVQELFGSKIVQELHRDGDEIFPFQINHEKEPVNLPAYRLDVNNDSISGFRLWMPGTIGTQ